MLISIVVVYIACWAPLLTFNVLQVTLQVNYSVKLPSSYTLLANLILSDAPLQGLRNVRVLNLFKAYLALPFRFKTIFSDFRSLNLELLTICIIYFLYSPLVWLEKDSCWGLRNTSRPYSVCWHTSTGNIHQYIT